MPARKWQAYCRWTPPEVFFFCGVYQEQKETIIIKGFEVVSFMSPKLTGINHILGLTCFALFLKKKERGLNPNVEILR